MSEQSPWGQPPPPSTPTGGSYPPPPQGPPAGPPGGPPGGWSPPSYGGPPSGPPPKKRNTAAIAAIVGGVVVAITAVVVLLVVTGGDDEPETAGDEQSSSASPTDPASDPTADAATPTPTPAPTEPTSAATEDPPADLPDDAIIGDGYAFQLPGIGWMDALGEVQESDMGSTLDTIIILGASLDLAQSNILVEALSSGGAPDLETLEPQWKRNLSGTDGAVPEDIPDITIDGERAIGVRFTDRLNVNGILIDQVAYLALHNGNQYSVALTLPSENDAVSEGDFEKVLDSWTWTS